METNLKSTVTQNQASCEQAPKTKIIIRRTFGDQSLLDLYAEYVAEKILEEMYKQKEPLISRS